MRCSIYKFSNFYLIHSLRETEKCVFIPVEPFYKVLPEEPYQSKLAKLIDALEASRLKRTVKHSEDSEKRIMVEAGFKTKKAFYQFIKTCDISIEGNRIEVWPNIFDGPRSGFHTEIDTQIVINSNTIPENLWAVVEECFEKRCK